MYGCFDDWSLLFYGFFLGTVAVVRAWCLSGEWRGSCWCPVKKGAPFMGAGAGKHLSCQIKAWKARVKSSKGIVLQKQTSTRWGLVIVTLQCGGPDNDYWPVDITQQCSGNISWQIQISQNSKFPPSRECTCSVICLLVAQPEGICSLGAVATRWLNNDSIKHNNCYG